MRGIYVAQVYETQSGHIVTDGKLTAYKAKFLKSTTGKGYFR